MKPAVSSLALAAVLAATAASLALAAAARGPAHGDVIRGRAVFLQRCALCHKPDGSGGKLVVPAGNPSRDFHDAKFWASRTDDQLRATINSGIAKSGMVAWKGILKPQEIEDVLTYIHTFNPDAKK